MRTFQPQMAPQMSAVDQYPNSGMRVPQIDAIRRARASSSAPLYAAAEEVMGNTKPAVDTSAKFAPGGTKPMMQGGTKPYADPSSDKFGSTRPPSFNDPRLAQFGRKPAMVGAPSGRGMPGIPGPAPRVREVM